MPSLHDANTTTTTSKNSPELHPLISSSSPPSAFCCDTSSGNHLHNPNRNYDSNNYNNSHTDPIIRKNEQQQLLLLSRNDNECNFVQDFLFPPKLPREVQVLRLENLAVPTCYLVVGLTQGLYSPLLNVYPLDLGASEAQQVTISVVCNLAATLKIAFGFISDNFPLLGYRRKVYMLLGWLLVSTMMFSLLSLFDLSLPSCVDGDDVDLTNNNHTMYDTLPPTMKNSSNISNSNSNSISDSNSNNNSIDCGIPENAPTIPFLGLSFFLLGIGLWFADVMGDSIVAEKTRLEPDECKGNLQAVCYACRFFGMMAGALVSTFWYSVIGPRGIVAALGTIPLIMIPLIGCFRENRNIAIPSLPHQCNEIWRTVCSRSVWQPLGFVFLFNLLQLGNGAWRQFLKSVLYFTDVQLNSMVVSATILVFFGVVTYKQFFMHCSWRRIYQLSILLNGFLSALQLLLIKKITFGLSPYWFAFGDDAFGEFMVGFQFLPMTIMMVNLCPSGSEGISYAMFTAITNIAINLSAPMSTCLLGIWDVRKETLEQGDVSGMLNLTVLTTCIQMTPILFLGWLPHSREDLFALSTKSYSSSSLGGGLFLFILFGSLGFLFVMDAFNLMQH